MKKAQEEFGTKVGGKFGDELGGRVINAVERRASPAWLKMKKNRLAEIVRREANRPVSAIEHIVSSAPYEGLRKDYIRMCTGTTGGLVVVYDKPGTGKSYALQAVARAKSSIQPGRFLVINISGAATCQQLYETIKQRVLGDVQDFDISPEQLAQVIRDGLCGPKVTARTSGSKISLPKTQNACRIDIDSQYQTMPKRNDFPILVIDEFAPTDFAWDKEYTMQELFDGLGEAFEFFVHLTGVAYQEDGFVAFVGTKSEAFARAIHEINGGSKAALAVSTTIKNRQMVNGCFSFDDWRGLPWSTDAKIKVVRAVHERDFKQALRGQGLSESDIELSVLQIFTNLCSHDDRNIRQIMDIHVPDALAAENEKWRATLQARSQFSPVAGCVEELQDLFRGFFSTY